MSVLVKHRLLFLYSNKWVFWWCLADAEGCEAEFIIKSLAWDLLGKEQQFSKKEMCASSACAGMMLS